MEKFMVFCMLYLYSVSCAINQTESVFIQKCTDFVDTRQFPNIKIFTIPDSLSSQAAYEHSNAVEFQLWLSNLTKKDILTKNVTCSLTNYVIRSMSWNTSNTNTPLPKPRNFHAVSSGSSNRHQHYHFTETGHFYDASSGNYYKADGEYCVKSISDDNISVRICANVSAQNTVVLPKCCAIDETLLFWRRQCKRLNETIGITPWQPPIYKSIVSPHTKADLQINIMYQMAQLPHNCTLVKYNDGSFEELGFVWMAASKVDHFNDKSKTQEKDNVRLILPDRNGGKVGVIVFHDASRKWRKLNHNNFCVDGFHYSKQEQIYSGKPNNFVVFYCENQVNEEKGITKRNEDELEWKSRIYVVASLIALMFLLATIIVYVVLWDNHMLKDMIITCYIISTFGSYLFLTVAHMVFLYPSPEMTGLHTRGPFCYTVATLAHFFYLSSYLWLTIMNFDIWITFKSCQFVKRDSSKGWHKFAIYSCVGWIFPASLITAFVAIDYVYRDPLTEVPVPDYAMGTCFVSPEFRGEYVYTPMAIVLAVNVMLIGMTMWVIIEARRQRQARFLKTGSMSNANNYNAKLFGKIFVLMGGTYTVEFLTWYYNNDVGKPWLIVGFEVINNFTPVILFFILCVNDKIISQLRDKYQRFMGGKQQHPI